MSKIQIVWLIWSNEHGKWWGPGRRGYVSHIDQAGRYPRRIVNEILRESIFGGVKNEVGILAPENIDRILGGEPDEVRGVMANILAEWAGESS